jgi:hypothetical protein
MAWAMLFPTPRSVTIEADVSVLGTASLWSVAYQVTVLGEIVLREVVIPK